MNVYCKLLKAAAVYCKICGVAQCKKTYQTEFPSEPATAAPIASFLMSVSGTLRVFFRVRVFFGALSCGAASPAAKFIFRGGCRPTSSVSGADREGGATDCVMSKIGGVATWLTLVLDTFGDAAVGLASMIVFRMSLCEELYASFKFQNLFSDVILRLLKKTPNNEKTITKDKGLVYSSTFESPSCSNTKMDPQQLHPVCTRTRAVSKTFGSSTLLASGSNEVRHVHL